LSDSEVHAVAIDGERATAEQIASGHYSFWSFAHLYTRDSSTPGTGEIMLFLQFMQSSEVAQLALQLGYISLSEMNAAPVSTSLVAHTTEALKARFVACAVPHIVYCVGYLSGYAWLQDSWLLV
jgi:hypothetical protein